MILSTLLSTPLGVDWTDRAGDRLNPLQLSLDFNGLPQHLKGNEFGQEQIVGLHQFPQILNQKICRNLVPIVGVLDNFGFWCHIPPTQVWLDDWNVEGTACW